MPEVRRLDPLSCTHPSLAAQLGFLVQRFVYISTILLNFCRRKGKPPFLWVDFQNLPDMVDLR